MSMPGEAQLRRVAKVIVVFLIVAVEAKGFGRLGGRHETFRSLDEFVILLGLHPVFRAALERLFSLSMFAGRAVAGFALDVEHRLAGRVREGVEAVGLAKAGDVARLALGIELLILVDQRLHRASVWRLLPTSIGFGVTLRATPAHRKDSSR